MRDQGRRLARARTGGAATALSFLDVLANALGAMVLLFVALAALQAPQAGGSKAAIPFVRFEWTVHQDPGALLRIRVTPPSAVIMRYAPEPAVEHTAFYVGVDQLERAAGPAQCTLPGMRSHSLIGFDVAWSPNAAYAASDDPNRPLRNRTFVLRLHDPEPGSWRADAMYFDRADGVLLRRDPLHVTLTTSTDRSSSADPPFRETFRLAFGELLEGPRISIGTAARPLWGDEPRLAICGVEWTRK
ncbi:hypothetical protein JYK14_00355 [Siccirubricoccus sp. KC 17139]|uniref:DUF3047 domain-containing protein n=1 Tax=Siccirubricoccus soli TaxID=2899147 RepID=A0ABT1CY99_9PROT|nr:hypothetical protein [Siccirubricoccus soli]MCO6414633.1 hypothetical protein [Siccirubricoccus soli]MCP2680763.1 hypothetical protein [Siccirubricoccus soli]